MGKLKSPDKKGNFLLSNLYLTISFLMMYFLVQDLVLDYLHRHGFNEVRDELKDALHRRDWKPPKRNYKSAKRKCCSCRSLAFYSQADWLVLNYLKSKPEFLEVSEMFKEFLIREPLFHRYRHSLIKCLNKYHWKWFQSSFNFSLFTMLKTPAIM